GVVRNVNVAMVQERQPDISRQDAHTILNEIEQTGDAKQGIKPGDVLLLPSVKFFRKRGAEEFLFQPYDLRGNLLTEGGKSIAPEQYLGYLATVLPARFIGTREYDKYVDQMREYYAGR
ncbi:MAG TPA: hypothetical protein VG778_08470, partial [Blastocatellia bacterium]|nr:hypothetical protein [Blastocatellia bacterium]